MKRLSQSLRALICFVCLAIIFPVTALADGITHYTYDSAGNRTGSTHVLVLRESDKDSERKNSPMQDDLTDRSIKIYPNPTYGRFCVEITGTESLDSISITVYSMNGTMLYHNDNPETVNEIDITSSPKGIYLLIIAVKEEKSTWKIIKA